MDSHKDLKISVLDAMKWLKQSWNDVTEATIKNCFKHCSFTQDDDASEEQPGEDPDLQPLYEELSHRGAPVEGTLEDFRTSDNNVETTGSFSDQDIVNSILGVEPTEDDEADDDSDESIICPTVDAYRAALEVVSRYVTCCSNDPRHDQALQTLENLSFQARSKQTRLTDFFSSSTVN